MVLTLRHLENCSTLFWWVILGLTVWKATPMPAVWTPRSTRPCCSTVESMTLVTSSTLVMSPGTKDTFLSPDCSKFFWKAASEDGRSRTTDWPPRAAMREAVAQPRPEAPPPMMAIALRKAMVFIFGGWRLEKFFVREKVGRDDDSWYFFRGGAR